MKVRFGYVAIALGVPQGSPNKTITVKNFEKITAPADRQYRLNSILRENLDTTRRILRYNAAHQVHIYRFTSKTVPLATHPYTIGWDYINDFKEEWAEIGEIIKQQSMRVSAHPDHYTLLNSPQPDVLTSSIKDLEYHVNMLEAMNLETAPQLVMHIGGFYKNKESSIARFITEFNNLPDRIRLRLMLENDDKVYSAADVLSICQKTGSPMILDIHHHKCVNHGDDLRKLWPAIVQTWRGAVPKIHVSSPKNKKDFRSHADCVNPSDLIPFLHIARETGSDFDVMIEAKNKDLALFQLLDDLEKTDNIHRIEQASLEL